MKEECLICKAPLEYLEHDVPMECEICGKKENSKTRCVNGHYVCNDCHTKGLDSVIGVCLAEIAIIEKMMDMPFCHMHGPEHHVMVGCALLTAYKNAGGDVDLPEALREMMARGKNVPGGSCGFWGACGAGISSGMFVSIISKSTVRVHHLKIHAAYERALCPFAQNDGEVAGADRGYRRAALLQERFVSLHSLRRGLCKREVRR